MVAGGKIPDFKEVKDSGTRRDFSTGANRDCGEGKGRYDLLPCYAIYRLARHFENGAVKYEDRNWEKGIPLHCYIDSAMRHLFKFLGGSRDEDHMAAAAWNILCYIETEQRIRVGKLPTELDDVPTQEILLAYDPDEKEVEDAYNPCEECREPEQEGCYCFGCGYREEQSGDEIEDPFEALR